MGDGSFWKELSAIGSKCTYFDLDVQYSLFNRRGDLFYLKGMTLWGQKGRYSLKIPTRSNSPIGIALKI